MFAYQIYRAIMDAKVNPLRHLPPARRFQVMTFLSIMWTLIFCAGTGAWLWYGELLGLHVAVALGFLITGLTFRQASQVGASATEQAA